ncbi:hypothetical protein BVZ23_22975 [Klebsiella variicola]|uniref:hypothetical protein n=1 Tax=Klebsiella variicola TaxID=244366 RepID=UPI000A2E50F0|nr:hypothetical protein [Klebsiella variicola]OSZ08190.1 hypothetical protein BVZ23_22975 [Klebsiella variicola]
MNPEQFIKNNVVKALLTDGYSAEQAEQGGERLFHTTGAHLNRQPSVGISLMTAWTKPEQFSSTAKRKAPKQKGL